MVKGSGVRESAPRAPKPHTAVSLGGVPWDPGAVGRQDALDSALRAVPWKSGAKRPEVFERRGKEQNQPLSCEVQYLGAL